MLSLEEVKNELDKTYDDPLTDRKLTAIMRRAESKVRKYVGIDDSTEFNAEEDELFINYCRYADNNALDMFEVNFQREINEARAVRMVEAMASAEEGGESGT